MMRWIYTSALALSLALLPTQQTVAQEADSGWDAQRELIVLINSYRTSNGLPALRPKAVLQSVAAQRSQDMGTRNYFAHEIPPDGHYFEVLLDTAGVRFAIAGENIARTNAPASESPHRVYNGFLNSPAHRANLLEPGYTELGVGVWRRPDGMEYYTTLFLQPTEVVAHGQSDQDASLADSESPLVVLAR